MRPDFVPRRFAAIAVIDVSLAAEGVPELVGRTRDLYYWTITG
jgi:hypothetical protein